MPADSDHALCDILHVYKISPFHKIFKEWFTIKGWKELKLLNDIHEKSWICTTAFVTCVAAAGNDAFTPLSHKWLVRTLCIASMTHLPNLALLVTSLFTRTKIQTEVMRAINAMRSRQTRTIRQEKNLYV